MNQDEDKEKMRRSYALLINMIHDMGFHGIEENKDGWGISFFLAGHSFPTLMKVAGNADSFPALYHHAPNFVTWHTNFLLKEDILVARKGEDYSGMAWYDVPNKPDPNNALHVIIQEEIDKEYNDFVEYLMNRILDNVYNLTGVQLSWMNVLL